MNYEFSISFAGKLALLAGFGWNVFLFTRALRTGFTRPEGVPLLMRALAFCGTIATLVDGWLLWASVTTLPFVAIGLLLLTVSQLVFRAAANATAQHKLSLAFSCDAPTQLNQTGIYQRVRHPFYLAYTLTWLAAAIATRLASALVVLVVMLGFYLAAARREEKKFLGSPLATDYRIYQNRAGMFFPKHRSGQPQHIEQTK
ncbi:MAG: hypothetical protein RL380_1163 [Verrucomicrobiota bacterium]